MQNSSRQASSVTASVELNGSKAAANVIFRRSSAARQKPKMISRDEYYLPIPNENIAEKDDDNDENCNPLLDVSLETNKARIELQGLYQSMAHNLNSNSKEMTTARTRNEKLLAKHQSLVQNNVALLNSSSVLQEEVEAMIKDTVEFARRVLRENRHSKVQPPPGLFDDDTKHTLQHALDISYSSGGDDEEEDDNNDEITVDGDGEGNVSARKRRNRQSASAVENVRRDSAKLKQLLTRLHTFIDDLRAFYKSESAKCDEILVLQTSLDKRSVAVKQMEETVKAAHEEVNEIKVGQENKNQEIRLKLINAADLEKKAANELSKVSLQLEQHVKIEERLKLAQQAAQDDIKAANARKNEFVQKLDSLESQRALLRDSEKSMKGELQSLKDAELVLDHGRKSLDDREADIRERENQLRATEHAANEKHLHALREVEAASAKELAVDQREALLKKRDAENKEHVAKLQKEAADALNEARTKEHECENMLHNLNRQEKRLEDEKAHVAHTKDRANDIERRANETEDKATKRMADAANHIKLAERKFLEAEGIEKSAAKVLERNNQELERTEEIKHRAQEELSAVQRKDAELVERQGELNHLEMTLKSSTVKLDAQRKAIVKMEAHHASMEKVLKAEKEKHASMVAADHGRLQKREAELNEDYQKLEVSVDAPNNLQS